MKSVLKAVIKSAGYKLAKSNERHNLYGEAKLYGKLYSRGSLSNRAFYNLGSGNWRHPFWTNVDYVSDYYNYDESLIDIAWDITEGKPLPIETGSAELCYCSHTVEHLQNDHIDHMFREARRILKPGGVLRVTTPDIRLYCQAWKRRDVFFYYHYGCLVPFGEEPGNFTSETMSIWLVNEFASQLVQSACPGHQPKYAQQAELLESMSRLIPHLVKHLPHVGNSQLALPVLLQQPQLLGRDLILREAILRGMEGAHVADEGLGDPGRQFRWFAGHGLDIGCRAVNYEFNHQRRNQHQGNNFFRV